LLRLQMERHMRKYWICGGFVAASLLSAGGAVAETGAEESLKHAGQAEVVLWEGVSAVYHFAADAHSPFRAALANEFNENVEQFEYNLSALRVSPYFSGTYPERLAHLEQHWSKFKSAGTQIIKSGRDGVCCTSFQLARFREMADNVGEDLAEVMDIKRQ
jgi:hypothetical protein